MISYPKKFRFMILTKKNNVGIALSLDAIQIKILNIVDFSLLNWIKILKLKSLD